jgi:hypothetical protein
MPSRAAWVEIDLGAIAHNYQEIRRHVQKDAKLCAVVKADAYGHGAIAVARKAIAAGAEYLALATISEALKLREAGFTTPLLILGLTKAEHSFDIVDADITQTVCRLDLVEALSAEAVSQGKTVKVHLAVDTGLGRIGVRPEDAASMARAIVSLPNVALEGVFSHFALADTADKSFAMEQVRLFERACQDIERAGIRIPIRHIAESAAILDLPDVHYDMVRAGIIQYGIRPSSEVSRSMTLRPAMKFCARIVYIKTVAPGTSVGYADGFLRAYAGGSVEVHGKRAPIAGRICMDQCMIDVTDIPEAAVGDPVTLFGSETLTADEVAARAGTISYEVLCLVSKHVSRIYSANRIAP